MNFLSLRYFLEVAKHLSFSQASKKLHISQPGLSQQISSLEKQLGVKLLNRNTRNVSLTPEGKYLYQEIGPSFEGIEQTIQYMIKNKSAPNKKIKIATVPSAANNYIPKLFKIILAQHPKIELQLLETSSTLATDLIKQQKYHMSFIRTPIHKESLLNNGINIVELKKYPLKFMVSSEHSLSNKTVIDLKKAKDEYFIHYDVTHAPSLDFLFQKACLLSGFMPKKLCTVSELITIYNLVSNNLGVAIIPEDMIQLINTKNVKVLDIHNIPTLYSSISVISNKANSSSLNMIKQIISTVTTHIDVM